MDAVTDSQKAGTASLMELTWLVRKRIVRDLEAQQARAPAFISIKTVAAITAEIQSHLIRVKYGPIRLVKRPSGESAAKSSPWGV
jgi:hypothetical protein